MGIYEDWLNEERIKAEMRKAEADAAVASVLAKSSATSPNMSLPYKSGYSNIDKYINQNPFFTGQYVDNANLAFAPAINQDIADPSRVNPNLPVMGQQGTPGAPLYSDQMQKDAMTRALLASGAAMLAGSSKGVANRAASIGGGIATGLGTYDKSLEQDIKTQQMTYENALKAATGRSELEKQRNQRAENISQHYDRFAKYTPEYFNNSLNQKYRELVGYGEVQKSIADARDDHKSAKDLLNAMEIVRKSGQDAWKNYSDKPGMFITDPATGALTIAPQATHEQKLELQYLKDKAELDAMERLSSIIDKKTIKSQRDKVSRYEQFIAEKQQKSDEALAAKEASSKRDSGKYGISNSVLAPSKGFSPELDTATGELVVRPKEDVEEVLTGNQKLDLNNLPAGTKTNGKQYKTPDGRIWDSNGNLIAK